MTLLTVGHSTRTAAEFIHLLRAHDVRRLVDVRRYPGSRRHPHFAKPALSLTLAEAGIAYRHEPDLGGRRASESGSAAASPNGAWRSASFRAYADHMATPEFAAALERLIADGKETATAVMCAEAVPWRCHRQLIADALVARGIDVANIIDAGRAEPHRLNAHARVAGDGAVTYPPDDPEPQRSLF